ncbi:MAG TPA: hypothetical protein VLJ60_04130 [bacterium]|nr:hypothetical protein [bacterium]
MSIYLFRLTLKHDSGTFRIKTASSSEESAVKTVCKAENCPKSAIIKIEKLKTIYEVKK